MFVPVSSPTVIGQVINGAKYTDSFYLAVEVDPDKTFNSHKGGYVWILSTINSIQLQDSIRPKSGVLLLEVGRLKKNFQTFMATHQNKGALNKGELETYHNILNALWAPILITEKNYK